MRRIVTYAAALLLPFAAGLKAERLSQAPAMANVTAKVLIMLRISASLPRKC